MSLEIGAGRPSGTECVTFGMVPSKFVSNYQIINYIDWGEPWKSGERVATEKVEIDIRK